MNKGILLSDRDISGRKNQIQLMEGVEVEAYCRNKGRYLPGRIKFVREDGTFDIEFDNGEFEKCVQLYNI